MAQFLRPDSNVTQTSWTNGFAAIDEITPSDADFAYGANNTSTATLEVGLSNPTTPAGGTCTVRWRHAQVNAGTLSSGGGTPTQTCGLYQGTTLITSSTVTPGGTWTQATFTFQVSSITNWTDLRLRWTQSGSGGGGNARGTAVSWAEVETPDAAGIFTLPADPGSFNDTGQDVGTLYNRQVAADLGTFNENGQAANTLAARLVGADVRAFLVGGQDATLFRGRLMPAETGLFNETGQDAGGVRGFSLTADTGAFNDTGQDAGSRRTYNLAADARAFAATGQAAGTLYGRTVIADSRAYSLAGQDAGSRRIYSMAADTCTVVLGGQDATLKAALRGISETGVFAVSGQAVDLFKGVPVIGGVGQFIADFQPADFLRTYFLEAGEGLVDVTGQDAALPISRQMVAQSAQFALTGGATEGRRAVKPAVWTASTSVAAGYLVRATVIPGTGLVFKAQNSGTTGGTQPTWPTLVGNTVVDGTVTWVAVSLISGEFQSSAPSAIIELFELQLVQALHGSNDIYRFHAGANATANHSDIVWAGSSYMRFPIEAEGFEYTGNGQLPRPRIRISNIFSTVSAILTSVNQITPGSDLTGAKVTRIRTLAKYLDDVNFEGGSNPFGQPDPNAEFPREIYYIDRKSAENRAVVEFELASALDLAGVRGPKRQCIANVCQWKYRSAECSYTGGSYFDENDQPVGSLALDVCGKRLSSCEKRFGVNAELPFGSFPGVGAYTT